MRVQKTNPFVSCGCVGIGIRICEGQKTEGVLDCLAMMERWRISMEDIIWGAVICFSDSFTFMGSTCIQWYHILAF